MEMYAYLRVSTTGQVESGAGLDAQLDTCRAYAQRLGQELVRVFTDEGVSGARGLNDDGELDLTKRPGLMEALDTLERGDVLVVAKRDRLGRDTVLVALVDRLFTRRGITIQCVDCPDSGSPADQLMRHILDAFAEYERQLIRCRTRGAMQAKKARGERVGSIPFGSRLGSDGKLEENGRELDAIRYARGLRADGIGYGTIARMLGAAGFEPRGREWHTQSVKRMLGGGE